MITVYKREGQGVTCVTLPIGQLPPAGALWIDMLNPDDSERDFVSKGLRISLPTLQDMQEIEASSRLYSDEKAIYMTVNILIGSDTPDPIVDVLLIVLLSNGLITVRYSEPKSLTIFAQRLKTQPELFTTAEDGVLALLDAISDRVADILEALGRKVDSLSRQIFDRPPLPPRQQVTMPMPDAKAVPVKYKEQRLQNILCGIGQAGDTTHKIRNCNSSLMRLVAYLGPQLKPRLNGDQAAKIQALEADLQSLNDHAQFVTQETSYLLDATLGQINIEQNNIIKILSIVMVAFTPPTFFASMWGMNFHAMHEYDWAWGYAMALGVMVISAVLPLIYFKKRGWL